MVKRLFIASEIHLNELALKEINTIRESLNKNTRVSWVQPEQMHITLKFLGDTPDSEIPKIIHLLNQCAKISEQFSVNLQNFGVFTNIKNPKVLWLGINDNNEFSKIAHTVNKSLSTIGITEENKSFRPHLTIGRIRSISDSDISLIQQQLDKYRNFSFGEMKINEFHLFESRLTPGGPIYTKLKSFSLS